MLVLTLVPLVVLALVAFFIVVSDVADGAGG